MCLSIIVERIEPTAKEVTGYKVLFCPQGSNRFNFFHFPRGKNIKIGKDLWLRAREMRIQSGEGQDYKSGFHFYKYKRDALKNLMQYNRTKVVKIRARYVHTVGVQNHVTVLVARQINFGAGK